VTGGLVFDLFQDAARVGAGGPVSGGGKHGSGRKRGRR
jgi:hypothetical protein